MNGMCLSCDFNNLDYLCFVWFRFFFIMGRPKKMWHGLDLKILAIKWASENANRNVKIKIGLKKYVLLCCWTVS